MTVEEFGQDLRWTRTDASIMQHIQMNVMLIYAFLKKT